MAAEKPASTTDNPHVHRVDMGESIPTPPIKTATDSEAPPKTPAPPTPPSPHPAESKPPR